MTLDDACLRLGVNPKNLKPKQRTIIEGLLNNESVFGILPTGFGKSLCFQAPAIMTEGTTLVFSPLISLMNDQVQSLKAHGVAAEQWNSTISASDKKKIKAKFEAGELDLLYLAPEALSSRSWKEEIKYPFINYMVIDEVHCLSHWGQDFRPDYLRLYSLIDYIQPKGMLACSATIDPYDYELITQKLKFDQVVCGEMTRPNLRYTIRDHSGKRGQPNQDIIRDIRSNRYATPLLLFCATVRRVQELYNELNKLYPGQVGHYHGQRKPDERHEAQEKFLSGEYAYMVATNAFGMGVNKPDIRSLIHADLPISLTGYVQEAGRAGRDGKPSNCILYYPFTSIHRIQFYFIECKNPNRATIEKVHSLLEGMGPNPVMTQNELSDIADINKYAMPAVLAVLKKYGALETEATVKQGMNIKKIKPPESEPAKMVYDLLKDGSQNLTTIAKNLEWEYKELRSFLNDLTHAGHIQYALQSVRPTRATCFNLTGRGLALIDWEELQEKRKQNYRRFEDMIAFSKSKHKPSFIREYFEKIKTS